MAISINVCLDLRAKRTGKNEESEYPIKITITKARSTAYLSTGIQVLPCQWKERKVTGRSDKSKLNDYLDSLKTRIRHIINEGVDKYKDMTATEIKNDIASILDGTDAKRHLFLPYFLKYANARNSKRTKEIYMVTYLKINKLIPKAEKIKLDDVDLDWLEHYDELLIERGNNASTRSMDFRNIRAVIRDALKHRLIHENPFDLFDMPNPESPDRALTIEQMRTFVNAEVKPWEKKYQDFFILSFLLCGINTVDLMNLKEIENGRINYTRQKTGVATSIKVEPEAMEIINRYAGKSHLIEIMDRYAEAKTWTSKVDKALKGIAQRNGLPLLSMYWARHTWATIAGGDLGIDDGVVGDALAHKPAKKVTNLYIRRKDYSKVDEANRQVIDAVFGIEKNF